MLPSFRPVRTAFVKARIPGVQCQVSPGGDEGELEPIDPHCPVVVDSGSGVKRLTLSKLKDSAPYRMYPDNPWAQYGPLLGIEADDPTKSPFTKDGEAVKFGNRGKGPKAKVAIVGGGMSGLLTAYQLGKMGLKVTVYEAGSKPDDPTDSVPFAGGLRVTGAGRIAQYNVDQTLEDEHGQRKFTADAQLGGMRFPANAHLFWHYLKVCNFAQDDDIFEAFANPNAIPTIYNGKSPSQQPDAVRAFALATWQHGYGTGPGGLPQESDTEYGYDPSFPNADFASLGKRHLDALTKISFDPVFPNASRGISVDNSPIDSVLRLMQYINEVGSLAHTLTHEQAEYTRETVRAAWLNFIRQISEDRPNPTYSPDADEIIDKLEFIYREPSYLEFLRNDDGKFDHNFTEEEIKTLGEMGIGTGGFAPLFSRSLTDLIRLVIWDFVDEYWVDNLAGYPQKLYEAANAMANVTFKHKCPVNGVASSDRSKKQGHKVSSYKYIVNYNEGNDPKNVKQDSDYDFLVLAASHIAVINLLKSSRDLDWKDAPGKSLTIPYTDARYDSLYNPVWDDMVRTDGMDTIKIFQNIVGPNPTEQFKDDLDLPEWLRVKLNANDPSRPGLIKDYDDLVRAYYGGYDKDNTGGVPLGATYLTPVKYHAPTNISGPNQPGFPDSKDCLVLHYSWGAIDPGANVTDPLINNDLDTLDAGLSSALGGRAIGYNEHGSFAFVENKNDIIKTSDVRQFLKDAMGSRISDVDKSNFYGFATSITEDILARNKEYFDGYDKMDISGIRWSKVPFINLAFKLDKPGYGSEFIYAFKASAESISRYGAWKRGDAGGTVQSKNTMHPSVTNLFFAGCSFSHYGGWVEGAFQSSLNVCAAISYRLQDAREDYDVKSDFNQTILTALIDKAPSPSFYRGRDSNTPGSRRDDVLVVKDGVLNVGDPNENRFVGQVLNTEIESINHLTGDLVLGGLAIPMLVPNAVGVNPPEIDFENTAPEDVPPRLVSLRFAASGEQCIANQSVVDLSVAEGLFAGQQINHMRRYPHFNSKLNFTQIPDEAEKFVIETVNGEDCVDYGSKFKLKEIKLGEYVYFIKDSNGNPTGMEFLASSPDDPAEFTLFSSVYDLQCKPEYNQLKAGTDEGVYDTPGGKFIIDFDGITYNSYGHVNDPANYRILDNTTGSQSWKVSSVELLSKRARASSVEATNTHPAGMFVTDNPHCVTNSQVKFVYEGVLAKNAPANE